MRNSRSEVSFKKSTAESFGKFTWNHLRPSAFLWYLGHFYSATLLKKRLWQNGYKRRKDSLETQAVLLIFLLELEISGMTVQRIHQNGEKWWLLWKTAQWKWFWGFFSQFMLLWQWCKRFWGSSEDPCRSKRLSQMLFVCYSLLNSQNISINNS